MRERDRERERQRRTDRQADKHRQRDRERERTSAKPPETASLLNRSYFTRILQSFFSELVVCLLLEKSAFAEKCARFTLPR